MAKKKSKKNQKNSSSPPTPPIEAPAPAPEELKVPEPAPEQESSVPPQIPEAEAAHPAPTDPEPLPTPSDTPAIEPAPSAEHHEPAPTIEESEKPLEPVDTEPPAESTSERDAPAAIGQPGISEPQEPPSEPIKSQPPSEPTEESDLNSKRPRDSVIEPAGEEGHLKELELQAHTAPATEAEAKESAPSQTPAKELTLPAPDETPVASEEPERQESTWASVAHVPAASEAPAPIPQLPLESDLTMKDISDEPFQSFRRKETTKERRARLAREIDEEDELERLELEKAKREQEAKLEKERQVEEQMRLERERIAAEALQKAQEEAEVEERRVAEHKRIEELLRVEEQRRLEEQRKEEEERKRIEEEKIIEEQKRAEEQRRLEEQQRLEEQRRIEEQERIEEEKRVQEQLRLEEEKRAQEQLRLEEEKRAQEQLRLEEEKRAQEQLRIEEEKRAQEQLRIEEEERAQELQRIEEEKRAQEQLRIEEEKQAQEQQRIEEEKRAQELQRLEEEKRVQEQQRREEELRLEREAREAAQAAQRAQKVAEAEAAEKALAAEAEEKRQREEQERLETERLEHERKIEAERLLQEEQRLQQEAREATEAEERKRRAELERLELEKRELEQRMEEERLLKEQERLQEEAKLAAEAAEAEERHQREAQAKLEYEAKMEVERQLLEQKRQEEAAREAAEAAEQAQREAETKAREQLEEQERRDREAMREQMERTEHLKRAEEQKQLEQQALEQKTRASEAEASGSRTAPEHNDPTRRFSHKSTTNPFAVPSLPESELPAKPAAWPLPETGPELAQISSRSATFPPESSSMPFLPSPPMHAPRPHAISQILADNRPPAPSPPVGRPRPRHNSSYDSDDDDDDDASVLLQPRRPFRGGEVRDTARSSTYPPPQPTHTGPFASRVPVEQNYNAPPPPPPPGYHTRYYPSAAPPYYSSHGHGLNYSNPNPYGPSSHSTSSSYQESWNQYPPGYPPYNNPQRHDSSGSRDYPHRAIENGPGIEDDPGDIFSRIAQTIPDLHVLLARYKETHSQLGVREELLRRASIEQEEKLRAKDDEIEDLKDKARYLEGKHSAEASRLRFQIGNLEEQVKEFQEHSADTEKYKKEVQDAKVAFDAAMISWEKKYKELQSAHEVSQRTAAEERENARREFDEWKSTTTTKHDAEMIALTIQFDRKLKDAGILAETQWQEKVAVLTKEKEDLIANHERHHLERQAEHDRARYELEGQLKTAHGDREDALRNERESRDFWVAERETMQSSWEEQRSLLEVQHKKLKDESDRAWIDLHSDTIRKTEKERSKVEQLVKEKEELLNRYNELKAESQKEKQTIRSVATNLESEKARLEKLMECYGDIAEIKGKGDTYYLVSFSQLQKQIIDLAATHFVHLPVRPPSEDLAQVPSNLPSFLGDSLASRQVRAAYVAHTVSKLITYRVFGPFLFSLGRRYDKADSLFLSMSNHIRDKSTRKEAIWRQQTLLAAFTSSGAKQRINTAAGTVVEEIVNAVKHFADPKEEEGIKIAVKRIVKLAAETWRFARLEREMIHAVMPALQDEEHHFGSQEYWPAYKSERPGALTGAPEGAEAEPQLLLRLFPVIYREPKHENFHGDGESRDEGCIYHNGLALYDDAEAVVTRADELKSAGLPPFTATSSPTTSNADGSGKFSLKATPPSQDNPPYLPTHRHSVHETADAPTTQTSRSVRISPTDQAVKSSNRLSMSKSSRPSPTELTDNASVSSAGNTPHSVPSSKPAPERRATYDHVTPGSLHFASPRDLIGHSAPSESSGASQLPYQLMNSGSQYRPSPEKAEALPKSPPRRPPPPPPSMANPAGTAEDAHGAPIGFHMPRNSMSTSAVQDGGSSDRPRPLFRGYSNSLVETMQGHSRQTNPESGGLEVPQSNSNPLSHPASPLFEAVDEIDAIQSHRTRNTSATHSRRRSSHIRPPLDFLEHDLPEVNPRSETVRRTSGYALGIRPYRMPDSERTDHGERAERPFKATEAERSDRERTERERTERERKSRYLCESRSAAVKGLYSDTPSAGQPLPGGSKIPVKSGEKKERDSRDLTRDPRRDSTRNSKEMKRDDDFPDSATLATWDTDSQSRTSEMTNMPTSMI